MDASLSENQAGARSPSPTGGVVLLTAGGRLAAIATNALANRFPNLVVIEELAEDRQAILKRRARLLGWPAALGQAACMPLFRVLGLRGKHRIAAAMAASGLDDGPPSSGVTVCRVPSVNSPACRELLTRLAPAVVAIYGTRIIRPDTLAATTAPFVNYHAGINPKYRGQTPAYWALAEGDGDHAGVTIHLVDAGVDTGQVLHQARVAFTRDDSIVTQPYVQMAAALPLFMRAIEEARTGRLAPVQVDLPSRQWFPPTLWRYLWNAATRGVW